MKALEQGLTVNELMERELWLEGLPQRIQEEWSKLANALEKAEGDWGVWTEWYQARLDGAKSSNQSLEIARVKLPLDIGPKGRSGLMRKLGN